MSISEQFLIGMQAYQQVKAELKGAGTSAPAVETSSPFFLEGGLLLGLAEDGLPVLLDLYNPLPGPLLVAGEGGSGKTAMLQSLARTSGIAEPGDIQFTAITPFPEEWASVECLPNSLGVWPAYHHSTQDLVQQLVDWASTLSNTRQVVLLLIDGFDLFTTPNHPSKQALTWLLANGPEGHVWPVVSLNPSRLSRMSNWLGYFHTRILGQVRNPRNISLLLDDAGINLADLQPGLQYALTQPEGWLKFILPPLA